jgi:hypothetical protein
MGNTPTIGEFEYSFFRTDKEALPGHTAELVNHMHKENPDHLLG